jgi:hypothetical protein
VTLAELVEHVNALPTADLLAFVRNLRAELGCSLADLTPDQIPSACALLPQGATTPETGQTGGSPSGDERWPEAATRRREVDDSPEARADRLEAGAATQRLTADLGGILVDQHGREYWQPLDQGPRVPAGVELWFFDPGAEAKMGAKDRQVWNQAWLLSARMMQLRSEWENERAGRARPLLVAADDSTPF